MGTNHNLEIIFEVHTENLIYPIAQFLIHREMVTSFAGVNAAMKATEPHHLMVVHLSW